MNEKLKIAILNNNDLYEAVFSAQNMSFLRGRSICYCLEKTPPLYSNLVTVSEKWQPDETLSLIVDNFKRENWEQWSVKDSFAVLDLETFGFRRLFDANWFYLAAARFTPVSNRLGMSYKIVENEKVLTEWRRVWDSDERLGRKIFQPAMLDDPNVRFVAGEDGEKIVSGCLINKTAGILGISNFFAPAQNIEYWSDIIAFVHESIEFTDIVGYQRTDCLQKIQPLGFETTGDLTVWLRDRAAE